jgi:hypothetical protein
MHCLLLHADFNQSVSSATNQHSQFMYFLLMLADLNQSLCFIAEDVLANALCQLDDVN